MMPARIRRLGKARDVVGNRAVHQRHVLRQVADMLAEQRLGPLA